MKNFFKALYTAFDHGISFCLGFRCKKCGSYDVKKERVKIGLEYESVADTSYEYKVRCKECGCTHDTCLPDFSDQTSSSRF